MLFRPCFGMVCRYSRARVPRFHSSLSFLQCEQRNSLSTEAISGGREIHVTQEDEKQLERWRKIEESSSIDSMLNSVVKVFFASTKHSIFKPWQTLLEEESSGSGFAISGNKILTNAHVVEVLNEHTVVRVKKHGSQTKYKAKVEKIVHECDLAILEIDGDEFWEDMHPLELGDIPPLGEVVSVVGYPNDGDNIGVTKGLVSGIETKDYLQSDTELLAIQIDATINAGNSGGPVILRNKVVGVAFESKFLDSKEIYFGIPTPIIKHFIIGDEESAEYAGFGSLDLSCQPMENAQIRNHFKMSPEMTGILINKINLSSGAHGILEKDDIILSIDGVAIGNDETVLFRNKERISFSHLVSMKKPGDTTLIKVLRKGKEHEYNISLKPVKPHVKVQQYYNLPSYYIFGGFVFVPLTKTYIDELSYMCKCALNDTAGEQQVIISEILSDDINEGYNSFKELLVEKVNGVKVKNLKHLCKLIEECYTEDVRLDLEDDKVMVLNYESAKKATSEILKRHSITSATSKDLCLPLQFDDPFKDNRIDLLPWNVLPQLLDPFIKI